MISISSASAHVAPTALSVSFNSVSDAEQRLDRIRYGEPVARVYCGESRAWWDLVDDDLVYTAIADEQFQAFVRLITALA